MDPILSPALPCPLQLSPISADDVKAALAVSKPSARLYEEKYAK